MAFWKDLKVSAIQQRHPLTGEESTSFVAVYYKKMMASFIDEAFLIALRQAVKEAVLTDPQYREQVQKAIQTAAVSLPLDAITAAVKEGIQGEK